MKRSFTILLTLLLAGVALAGCTGGDEADPSTPTPATPTPDAATPVVTPTPATPTPATPTPVVNETPGLDNGTYTLETEGVNTHAAPGQSFNWTLYVNGTHNATSDHVGAHYRPANATGPAELATMTGACPHASGNVTLPAVVNLTCSFPAPGNYTLFGHVRATENGTETHFWAPGQTVSVRNYTINLTGVPQTAQASNQSFSFTMTIEGTENVTSDHIGAHYWNATNAAPTVPNSTGACVHTAGGAIGTYTVTCQIPSTSLTPSTFYLRGHLLLRDDGSQAHYWSAEYPVRVVGSLL